MSHLDAEFKKQSLPDLRSLVADQVRSAPFYNPQFKVRSSKANKSTVPYAKTATTNLNA